MHTKRISDLMLTAILLSSACFLAAQSQPDENELLHGYVAQLQTNPNNQELRKKIIALAMSMNPPPDVPEDAQRFLVHGNTALKMAKTTQDVQDAVSEFQKATLIAPWFAGAYFNLAIAQGQAEDYEEAISNLKLYMLAAPHAPNLDDAKNKIYEMEYKAQKAEKERAAKQEAADSQAKAVAQQQAVLNNLSGSWTCSQGCISASVTAFGGNFQLNIVSGQEESAKGHMFYDDRHRLVKYGTYKFIGTMKDFNVEGTQTEPAEYSQKTHCEIPGDSHSFVGQINPAGTMISIRTELSTYTTKGSYQGSLLFGSWKCDDIRLDSRHPQMIILVRGAPGSPASQAPPQKVGFWNRSGKSRRP